jgi:rhomboid protease GluP
MEDRSAMSQDDTDGPPEPAEDIEVGARDRLLVALLEEDPELVLLQHEPALALLLAPAAPRRIVLIDAAGDRGPERVQGLVAGLLGEMRQGGPGGIETHVVAVGGGEGVAEALGKAAPRVQPAPMGFHHAGDGGGIARVAGKDLPILKGAAARAASGPGPSPERLAEARARGHELARREGAAASRLTGQNRVTLAITIACVALAGVSYLWGAALHDAALYRMGANSVRALREGQVWRLFAAAFLHADVIHLGVNMLALWSFGPLLEALLGRRRYVILYAASALGGSIASALGGPDRWSVGASGAIWGLMAAGIGVALRPRGLLPPLLIAQMRSRAWLPLLVNLGYSFRPGVDMLAHLGGGAVGFALAATVLTRGLRPVDQRGSADDAEIAEDGAVRAASIASAAAMALSVALGLALGRPWELSGAPALTRVKLPGAGVSLEVPEAIAGQVSTEDRGKFSITGIGQLASSPVAFEVIVAPLEGEVPAGELDAFLESERAALEKEGPSEATRKGPATRVTVGGRPMVRVEHERKGVALTTYLGVIGRREVLVRGYARKERPATWAGLEEKAAATLRAE